MPIYKIEGKKNGLQKYRVRVAFCQDGKHKQIERHTYGLAEAQLLESNLKNQLNQKQINSFSVMTVEELFNEYNTSREHEIRQTSFETNDKIYRMRIKAYLGQIKINKITPKILQGWKNEINKLELATKTKQHGFALLRAILNYAVKMEYLTKNALNSIDNFKETNFISIQDKLHYYTPEQFLKYVSNAKQNTYLNICCYVFFNLAFYTGMRKGELNALKWSDIENNTIHIRRSISQKLKAGDVETSPKNKSSYRDIQMPKPLITILEKHKELQKRTFSNFTSDFRVCGGNNCLRDTTLDNYNKYTAKQAELPHIRIHDFRHSLVSLLINTGNNSLSLLCVITKRIGDTPEMILHTYGHMFPDEQERLIRQLDEIL